MEGVRLGLLTEDPSEVFNVTVCDPYFKNVTSYDVWPEPADVQMGTVLTGTFDPSSESSRSDFIVARWHHRRIKELGRKLFGM